MINHTNLSKKDVGNIPFDIYTRNQDSFKIKNHAFNYKSYEKLYFTHILENSLISTATWKIPMRIWG